MIDKVLVKVDSKLDMPRISPQSMTFKSIIKFREYNQSIWINNPSNDPIFVEFFLAPEEFQQDSYVTELMKLNNLTY